MRLAIAGRPAPGLHANGQSRPVEGRAADRRRRPARPMSLGGSGRRQAAAVPFSRQLVGRTGARLPSPGIGQSQRRRRRRELYFAVGADGSGCARFPGTGRASGPVLLPGRPHGRLCARTRRASGSTAREERRPSTRAPRSGWWTSTARHGPAADPVAKRVVDIPSSFSSGRRHARDLRRSARTAPKDRGSTSTALPEPLARNAVNRSTRPTGSRIAFLRGRGGRSGERRDRRRRARPSSSCGQPTGGGAAAADRDAGDVELGAELGSLRPAPRLHGSGRPRAKACVLGLGDSIDGDQCRRQPAAIEVLSGSPDASSSAPPGSPAPAARPVRSAADRRLPRRAARRRCSSTLAWRSVLTSIRPVPAASASGRSASDSRRRWGRSKSAAALAASTPAGVPSSASNSLAAQRRRLGQEVEDAAAVVVDHDDPDRGLDVAQRGEAAEVVE